MYRVEIIKPHNTYTKDVLARNADDAYHQCLTPDDITPITFIVRHLLTPEGYTITKLSEIKKGKLFYIVKGNMLIRPPLAKIRYDRVNRVYIAYNNHINKEQCITIDTTVTIRQFPESPEDEWRYIL